MADDPWDSDDARAWAEQVRTGLLPKLRDSAMTGALMTTTEPDLKQAVEIGMTLLLGIPLVLIVTPGAKVPDPLAAAAFRILEFDPDNPGDIHKRLGAILEALPDRA